MKKNILAITAKEFSEIPSDAWKQHVAQTAQDISKMLSFMTKAHHQVRYFVVRELPRIGKPIPPALISEKLNLSVSETTEILEELERNLFFLVRNKQGDVTWAFPITVEKTPQRLTFSTGESLNAA